MIGEMKDKDDFTKLWRDLPEGLKDEMVKAIEESSAESPEEFLNEVFVGECPECGSRDTRDCEEVPEVEDITVGSCNTCGYLWCTECGRPVTKGGACAHWEICEKCTRKKNKFGDCDIPTWECEKVSVFEKSEDDEPLHTCAWCHKAIDRDAEVFAVGAKARKGMNLKPHEGSMIQIALTHSNKTVPAIVTTHNSEARKAGSDLVFMICGKNCGDLLKKALLKERLKIV
jgi:hypothetical protein